MKRMAIYLLLVTLSGVASIGCTPKGSTFKEMQDSPTLIAETTSIDDAQSILGSIIELTEPLTVAFPTLFQEGAAIPFPDGNEALPQLAAFLKKHPGQWILFVGAYDLSSELYAQRLASARAEIIVRYLTRQGVDMDEIEIIEMVDQTPLRLKKIVVE